MRAFVPLSGRVPLSSSSPLRHQDRHVCIRSTPKACLNASRREALRLLTTLPLLPLLTQPALADHTYVAAKRAYDRYHPRILSFLATVAEIGGLVKKNDVPSARELIADKQFDVRARRALSIYATSFSDNYVTETSRVLQNCVDKAFNELKLVADGVEPELHYERALVAIRLYYEEARLPEKELDVLS